MVLQRGDPLHRAELAVDVSEACGLDPSSRVRRDTAAPVDGWRWVKPGKKVKKTLFPFFKCAVFGGNSATLANAVKGDREERVRTQAHVVNTLTMSPGRLNLSVI